MEVAPDSALAHALRAVPRSSFLPADGQDQAGVDAPIGIGAGQTNSQPRTVVNMLTLLDVRPGQRVLDVGTGSGWTTALIAELVGPTGRVLGVERIPELTTFGARNVAALRLDWAEIRQAIPGVLGLPDAGPYDRILVSAEAARVPSQLTDQLAPSGAMVVPVRGRMLRLTKGRRGLKRETFGHYRFVPLIED